jgi:hypothetical protein
MSVFDVGATCRSLSREDWPGCPTPILDVEDEQWILIGMDLSALT